ELVVARSRHPFALGLLQQAEARGARTFDRCAAVLAVRDKARCVLALARGGVPVPPTFLAHRPVDLRHVPARLFPLLLKPILGDNARGIRLVQHPAELSSIPWGEEQVLAQQYVDAGGIDLKVYVAGERVWVTRRRSPLQVAQAPAVPGDLTDELRRLVRLCRRRFGLRLFGLDVLESGAGPLVVDVNEFPNYTGVAEAPDSIAGLLLAARGASVTCAP
ncbi:MAG: ATP-grasp domain-containing protein, partial [Candidatus Limnocylindria bacterium]